MQQSEVAAAQCTSAVSAPAALQGKDYTLIREDDLIGVLPRSGATAADVPELKPLSDRVLLKVRAVQRAQVGGVGCLQALYAEGAPAANWSQQSGSAHCPSVRR